LQSSLVLCLKFSSLQPSHYTSASPSYSPAVSNAQGLNLDLSRRFLPPSHLHGMAPAPQPKYVSGWRWALLVN